MISFTAHSLSPAASLPPLPPQEENSVHQIFVPHFDPHLSMVEKRVQLLQDFSGIYDSNSNTSLMLARGPDIEEEVIPLFRSKAGHLICISGIGCGRVSLPSIEKADREEHQYTQISLQEECEEDSLRKTPSPSFPVMINLIAWPPAHEIPEYAAAGVRSRPGGPASMYPGSMGHLQILLNRSPEKNRYSIPRIHQLQSSCLSKYMKDLFRNETEHQDQARRSWSSSLIHSALRIFDILETPRFLVVPTSQVAKGICLQNAPLESLNKSILEISIRKKAEYAGYSLDQTVFQNDCQEKRKGFLYHRPSPKDADFHLRCDTFFSEKDGFVPALIRSCKCMEREPPFGFPLLP